MSVNTWTTNHGDTNDKTLKGAGKISGVVLEFHLRGQVGSDYEAVTDSRSLQEESEIAVYVPSRLQLIAVWKHDQKWIRHPLV